MSDIIINRRVENVVDSNTNLQSVKTFYEVWVGDRNIRNININMMDTEIGSIIKYAMEVNDEM